MYFKYLGNVYFNVVIFILIVIKILLFIKILLIFQYLFLFIWLCQAYLWFICCRIWGLVPCLGIKPEPLALEGQSLRHWTTREIP